MHSRGSTTRAVFYAFVPFSLVSPPLSHVNPPSRHPATTSRYHHKRGAENKTRSDDTREAENNDIDAPYYIT
jgi:hypothetical protein